MQKIFHETRFLCFGVTPLRPFAGLIDLALVWIDIVLVNIKLNFELIFLIILQYLNSNLH